MSDQYTNLAEQPVYQSLIYPILMFGMPRNLALLLLTVTMVAVLSWGAYYFILITAVLMFFFRTLTANDPHFFTIAMDLMKMKKDYD
jgi:type IV secretory pathway VirB3-like protein